MRRGIIGIVRVLQLFFGLVPELVFSSVRPVMAFPDFVGAMPDLVFCGLFHGASLLRLIKPGPAEGLWVFGQAVQTMLPYLAQQPIRIFESCSGRTEAVANFVGIASDASANWPIRRDLIRLISITHHAFATGPIT
jgi:hypothetical protein